MSFGEYGHQLNEKIGTYATPSSITKVQLMLAFTAHPSRPSARVVIELAEGRAAPWARLLEEMEGMLRFEEAAESANRNFLKAQVVETVYVMATGRYRGGGEVPRERWAGYFANPDSDIRLSAQLAYSRIQNERRSEGQSERQSAQPNDGVSEVSSGPPAAGGWRAKVDGWLSRVTSGRGGR